MTLSDLKQAALKAYIRWAWLERNPGLRLKQHHLFSYLFINLEKEDCPYFGTSFRRMRECGLCPIKANNDCYHSWGTNYDRWEGQFNCFSTIEEAQTAAGNIARTAWQEYKRLGG